jgi:hypothetical protein
MNMHAYLFTEIPIYIHHIQLRRSMHSLSNPPLPAAAAVQHCEDLDRSREEEE